MSQCFSLPLFYDHQVKGPGPGQYDPAGQRTAEISSSFKSKVPRFNSRPSVSQVINFTVFGVADINLLSPPNTHTHRKYQVLAPTLTVTQCLDSLGPFLQLYSTSGRSMALLSPNPVVLHTFSTAQVFFFLLVFILRKVRSNNNHSDVSIFRV